MDCERELNVHALIPLGNPKGHAFMKSILTASIIFMSCAVSANATGWPQADIDRAIQVVSTREKNYIEECVTASGTKITYDVAQRDVNGDGVNELIVESYPAELGNGVTGCYGSVAKNMYLLSKAKGNWEALVIGGATLDFVFHSRQSGEMPDVELTGPGVCFPIQRHHMGEYKLWKVCDDNRQLFADAAPWIKDKTSVVPHEYGESNTPENAARPLSVSSNEASDLVDMRSLFDHNGSDVRISPSSGEIVYERPKKGISGTVKPGMLLFKASTPWDPYDNNAPIEGTAYVFKKGCEPAPYQVSGHQQGWHTLVLRGAAPVRDKNGCRVIGYKMNSNATLKFVSFGD